MISTNKNSPTILGNYFVLFLDIQGVRDGLFSGIPTVLLDGAEIGREKNVEVETLNRTIGEFCGALGQMVCFIKTKPEEYFDYLIQGHECGKDEGFREERLDEIRNLKVGIQQFSDSTLIYVRDTGDVARLVFQQLMMRTAFEMIKAMAKHVFMRGSMVYGAGWEVGMNCLFGPVLQQAYEMEERVAFSFRIVVSSEFFRVASGEMKALASAGADTTKPFPFKLISREPDGLLCFDYLAKDALQEYRRYDVDVMPFLSEAYNFAALRHRHFKEDALCNMRSAKLSMKYAMFLSYMDARLSSYKVDQKNAQS